MRVSFCLEDGGEELFSLESNDIGGLIAASKGDYIQLQHESYVYNSHIFNNYFDGADLHHQLIIYVDKYTSAKSDFLVE